MGELTIGPDGLIRMPEGPYGVIYPDPPWFFDDQTQKNSGASDHYDLMQDEELLAMAPFVDGLAGEDCALCMWASGARMDFACELIDAWGFRFVTVLFVWAKTYPTRPDRVVFSQGRYTRSTAEFVLLGARGSIPVVPKSVPQWFESPDPALLVDPATLPPEVIYAPRTNVHSEKPNEFRRRVEHLWPDARRIELFCRHAPAGWDAWGNQVGLLEGGPKTVGPWIADPDQGTLFGGPANDDEEEETPCE